jgi:hypothetical protein
MVGIVSESLDQEEFKFLKLRIASWHGALYVISRSERERESSG